MSNMIVGREEPPVYHDSPFVRWMRTSYVLVAAGFVCAIALQVFLAGASILVHPRYLGLHTTIGHVMQFFPLGLILLGLGGRLSWRLFGLTVLSLVLFALQYIFLWAAPSLGLPILRALHALNALALFWLALHLTQNVWRLTRAGDAQGLRSQLASTS